jgi:hypothetical protein
MGCLAQLFQRLLVSELMDGNLVLKRLGQAERRLDNGT